MHIRKPNLRAVMGYSGEFHRILHEREEKDRLLGNARAEELLRMAASPEPVSRVRLEDRLCPR